MSASGGDFHRARHSLFDAFLLPRRGGGGIPAATWAKCSLCRPAAGGVAVPPCNKSGPAFPTALFYFNFQPSVLMLVRLLAARLWTFHILFGMAVLECRTASKYATYVWRSDGKNGPLASCISRSLKVIGTDIDRLGIYDFLINGPQ